MALGGVRYCDLAIGESGLDDAETAGAFDIHFQVAAVEVDGRAASVADGSTPRRLMRSILATKASLAPRGDGTSPLLAASAHHRFSAAATAAFIFANPVRATSSASIAQYLRLNNSRDNTVCPPLRCRSRKISVTGATPSPG